MTICEHMDSWDNNKLIRISYIADGKNEIIKTHGISLYNAINQVCEMGGFNLEQYYEYLEIKRGV